MKHQVVGRPDFSLLRLSLAPGESVWTESGAMVAHTPTLSLETKARGGVLSGLARAALGGESFFLNKWTAQDGAGEGRIDLAPGSPGDVLHVPLAGKLMIQRGSFLACAESVTVKTELGGFKAVFAEGSFFLLAAEGAGDLFLASYGAIEPVDVAGEHVIDNGHLVAFDAGLSYKIERVGSWKATLLSGEGIVCRFSGRGRLWVQTRAAPPFASWIHPFRRVKAKNQG